MPNDDSSSPVDEPLSSAESENPATDTTGGAPVPETASVGEPAQGPARATMIAVAPLLFFSGLCALVYQVAWLRELKLVFGASTAANAAVLAVFMGGLGVGGLLLGRRADKLSRPLGLYANLELGVALSAALTPLLVIGGRKLYIAVGGSSVLGLSGATIVRLLLTVVVLGVPTFLMGGTLPAAAKAVSSASDARRRDVGTLYAVNTIGAVTGAFAANFVLLEVFGTRMTLWLACLVNALVGMTARAVSRRSATAQPSAPVLQPQHAGSGSVLPTKLRWFPSAAAAVAGFAFLLMELVWYRMLGPILGGSSYSFGLILCVALLGIGIGGGLYSRLGQNRPATLLGFAWTCALEALCLMIPFAVGDGIAVATIILRGFGALGFVGHVAVWTVVTSFVVLPAAIVSGYQFPLIIALFGKGDASLGRHVGVAYATNTVGSIAGSLAGGFGLIPLLSAPGCWRAVGGLLAASALATVAIAALVEQRRARVLIPAAAGVLAASLLMTSGPTAAWRHGGVGVGRSGQISSSKGTNDVIALLHDERRSIAWEADGVESSVAVSKRNGYSFFVNGKSDGNAIIDAPTQVMGGLIGAALVPAVRDAFVIGLGTGSTAGWLGRLPEIERVDVAELEPVILRVARNCSAVNENVLDNPKVRVEIGDARELLQTSRRRYDLIFSEPSNPYRAGIASLYTREFYESAASSLRDGGVFLQWLQTYDIDGGTVDTVLATLASVFPSVSVWQTEPGDLVLVASARPLFMDATALRTRLSTEPLRRAMLAVWGVDDLEGFLSHHLANPGFAQAVAAAEAERINLDDANTLEYAFARTVGSGSSLGSTAVLQAAKRLGFARPTVSGAPVDWGKVEAIQVLDFGPGEAEFVKAAYGPAAQTSFRSLVLHSSGDFAELTNQYMRRSEGPVPPPIMRFYADALARLGHDEAVTPIKEHRATHPIEADIFESRWLFARGRFTESAARLAAALERHRSDPWIHPEIASSALTLTVDLAARDRHVAPVLLAALSEPFAVRHLDEQRNLTRLRIAEISGASDRCVDLVAPFEPHPVWERGFLQQRLACYRSSGHPMAEVAESDIASFLARTPIGVASSVLGREDARIP